MGSFCKMGSLFLENGFNFNEWVQMYSLQIIKSNSLTSWNLSLDVTNSSNLLKANFSIAFIRSDIVAVSI